MRTKRTRIKRSTIKPQNRLPRVGISRVVEVCPDCKGTGESCGCPDCEELGCCFGCGGIKYI
jgi:hypothetical protein